MNATTIKSFGPADATRRMPAGMPTGRRDLGLLRSARGTREIDEPTVGLSPESRALLVALRGPMSLDDCVQTAGARVSDAIPLLRNGLATVVLRSAEPGSGAFADRQAQALVDALFRLSSRELYTLITRQAKLRLGLIRGFRAILQLERCEGQEEQLALALRFVDEVAQVHGEDGLARLHGELKA